MIIWSVGKQLTRVIGGKKPSLQCKVCKKATTFYESTIDEGLKLYFVVDLFKRTKRVLQCGECLGVCDYYEIFPEEKGQKEAESAAAAEAKKQKELQEQAKRDQAAAEERKRQEDLDHKKWQEEEKRKEGEVLDELEELKRKMGK